MFSVKDVSPLLVEVGEERRVYPHFNLADHDILIDLSVTALEEGVPRGRILSGPHAHNWSISVDVDGQVRFRLGNRTKWEFDWPIGKIFGENSLRVRIRRSGDVVETWCGEFETRCELP